MILLKELFHHSLPINDLCFIEDKYLASASDDFTCKIYNLSEFQLVKVI